ncbi:MAG: hypothetical protein ACI9R3_004972 [Verrucomicrobiales bacterium]|jgi:hypothetical protein
MLLPIYGFGGDAAEHAVIVSEENQGDGTAMVTVRFVSPMGGWSTAIFALAGGC